MTIIISLSKPTEDGVSRYTLVDILSVRHHEDLLCVCRMDGRVAKFEFKNIFFIELRDK
jgi:hypothetical protein